MSNGLVAGMRVKVVQGGGHVGSTKSIMLQKMTDDQELRFNDGVLKLDPNKIKPHREGKGARDGIGESCCI